MTPKARATKPNDPELTSRLQVGAVANPKTPDEPNEPDGKCEESNDYG